MHKSGAVYAVRYFQSEEQFDYHIREISQLNEKLNKIYETPTLSFSRKPFREDIEAYAFVDKILDKFMYKTVDQVQDYDWNPYAVELQLCRSQQLKSPPIKQEVVPAERNEAMKFAYLYKYLEKVFNILEQLKAKYTKQYIPAGVQYFLDDKQLDYHQQKEKEDLETCDILNVVSVVYQSHKGLYLNQRLIERANRIIEWADLIRIEKCAKLILHKKKMRIHIAQLVKEGGELAKLFSVFILQVMMK